MKSNKYIENTRQRTNSQYSDSERYSYIPLFQHLPAEWIFDVGLDQQIHSQLEKYSLEPKRFRLV